MKLVLQKRREVGLIGTRKLYHELKSDFKKHRIKIGRDRLFTILRNYGLLRKKRKKRVFTTDSNHPYRKYNNLIKGKKVPTKPEKVWVSDITYISVGNGFSYLCLITDMYSKRIMGWNISTSLGRHMCLKALKMALRNRKYRDRNLIHHSDRGVQYCSKEYTTLLKRNSISISMSAKGNPYENAMAESMNAIMKRDYINETSLKSHEEAHRLMVESIYKYNCKRPHQSLNYAKPLDVHELESV